VSGLRAKLKARTASVHARVEQAFSAPHAGSSDGDYCEYLSKLYGIIKPIERLLCAVNALPVALERRRKTPLLEHDLAIVAPLVELDTYALCDELPAIAAVPRALGCLYVVEGSTLGGRVILRGLGDRFMGARWFLEAYGEETQRMWQELLAALEKRDASEEREIVEGAADTFCAFERWLVRA
jgi:heme oxygenase